MNAQLIANADNYFENYLGKTLEDFTRPFDEEMPCGPDLRVNGLFTEIVEARRADDPDLPRGDWQIELKRADWNRVTELTSVALSSQSKDLQLSAWLLESEIKQRGFAAIGPCLTLMHLFVDEHWQNLNPSTDEMERRYNIFRWIDEKLPVVINQIPIASNMDETEAFSGADLDRAYGNARLIETKVADKDELTGPFPEDINDLVARTANESYVEHFQQLQKGMTALDVLEEKLDELFGQTDAPGFSDLRSQLQKSLKFCESELDKRGVLEDLLKELDVDEEQDTEHLINAESAQTENEQQSVHKQKSTMDRQQAYQQLADIAHYLAEIEPHSPVPYLVMRAVEWGSFNTAELYQDLFLVNKGQIDLFEIMGIAAQQDGAQPDA